MEEREERDGRGRNVLDCIPSGVGAKVCAVDGLCLADETIIKGLAHIICNDAK